ncbi:MAG: AtpZ/AtpI family protein [Prolixibacteraceae bacterium]|nr:AtpZ/AtpI family protein [Prolixibacteraceae bacterium]
MAEDNKFDYMRSYAKYFGLVFQMIVLVVIGAFGGKWLDGYFHFETQIFTIILIILAAILSLYLFFKTIFSK